MIKIYLVLILIFLIICFCKKKKIKENFEIKYIPDNLVYSCMNFVDEFGTKHECKEFSVKNMENNFKCEEIWEEGCNKNCKNAGEKGVECIPKDYAAEETAWGKFKKYCESSSFNKEKISKIENEFAAKKEIFDKAVKEFNEKTKIYEKEIFEYKLKKFNFLEEQKSITKLIIDNPIIKEYLAINDEFRTLNPDNNSNLIDNLTNEVNDLLTNSNVAQFNNLQSSSENESNLKAMSELKNADDQVKQFDNKNKKLNRLKEIKDRLTELKDNSKVKEYINKTNSLIEPVEPTKPNDLNIQDSKKEFYRCSYASKCPSKGLLTVDQNLGIKNLSRLLKIVNSNDPIRKTLTDQFKCNFDNKNSCNSNTDCLWINNSKCMPKNGLCLNYEKKDKCKNETYCEWVESEGTKSYCKLK